MATAQELVTRAFRRLQAIDIAEQPSNAEMSHGITVLEEIINSWAFPLPELAIRTLAAEVTSGSTTLVFADTEHMADGLNVSGTGIPADAYITEVTNGTDVEISAEATSSGSAVDITLTPIPFPARHERGVVALLAIRLAEDLGMPVLPNVQKDADDGWTMLLADYMPDNQTVFDRALTQRLPTFDINNG